MKQQQLTNLLGWLLVAIITGLAALNWSTLTASAPLNLLIIQIEAPLGVVLMGATGAVVALFFVAYLRNQIGSLLETRRLLAEIQRVQALADKSEVSRIEALHQLVSKEFRLLNDRLSSPASALRASTANADSRAL